MAQRVDVGDRLTPGREHRGDIHPHLAAVMNRRNERRVSASDKARVRPTRSASSRTATAPASGTSPSPSAVTDNPCDHEVPFTWKVLPTLAERDSRQDSFSQARSTFQLINTDPSTVTMNDPG